jgi:hypothetical protein
MSDEVSGPMVVTLRCSLFDTLWTWCLIKFYNSLRTASMSVPDCILLYIIDNFLIKAFGFACNVLGSYYSYGPKSFQACKAVAYGVDPSRNTFRGLHRRLAKLWLWQNRMFFWIQTWREMKIKATMTDVGLLRLAKRKSLTKATCFPLLPCQSIVTTLAYKPTTTFCKPCSRFLPVLINL